MPSPSAHIQELICAAVAPSAVAAWNTMATELVNPTSTATKPAVTADKDKSEARTFIVPKPTKPAQGRSPHQATPADPAPPVRQVAPLGGRSEATGGLDPTADPAPPVRQAAPLGGRSKATGGP